MKFANEVGPNFRSHFINFGTRKIFFVFLFVCLFKGDMIVYNQNFSF